VQCAAKKKLPQGGLGVRGDYPNDSAVKKWMEGLLGGKKDTIAPEKNRSAEPMTGRGGQKTARDLREPRPIDD